MYFEICFTSLLIIRVVLCTRKTTCILIDTDECACEPCQNGGSCIDAVNKYTCTCDNGYEGPNCETGKSRSSYVIS